MTVAIASCGPASAVTTTTGTETSVSPPVSSSTTTIASVPTCGGSDLDVSVGTIEGAAGSTFTTILFENVGDGDCRLTGHPSVSYAASDGGEVVGESAVPSDQPSVSVLLTPGDQASAVLRQAQPANFPEDRCAPVQVWGLRVSLPGQSVPVYLGHTTTACSTGQDGRPSISVIQAGTDPTF